MILVDFNQTMIANAMMESKGNIENIQEDLFRHMALNSLRMYNSEFRDEYGELVVCCDGQRVWRKQIYPLYKANRKKEEDHNWTRLYEIFNRLYEDLLNNAPFKVFKIQGFEADDLIGTLALAANEKVLIISGDKDFRQLQTNPNIYQYHPIEKKYVVESNPKEYLFEMFLIGDKGDGIPNILSDDDVFICSEKRQKAMTKKRKEEFKNSEIFATKLQQDPELKRKFERNKKLIDLREIPSELQQQIHSEFHKLKNNKLDMLRMFMFKNDMKLLLDKLTDFKVQHLPGVLDDFR